MKYIRVLPAELCTPSAENPHPGIDNAIPVDEAGLDAAQSPNCGVSASIQVGTDVDGFGAQSSAQPHPGYGPAFTPLTTPCHIWQRSFDEDGYGYFRHAGKVIRAHVHYYVGKFGPVPDGLEIDHTCRNRACVNPDHLEAVTHLENCRRGRLVKTGMTIEKARTAREMKAAGKTQREIGEHLGIGVSLVAQIVGNRCWKESPLPAPTKEGA